MVDAFTHTMCLFLNSQKFSKKKSPNEIFETINKREKKSNEEYFKVKTKRKVMNKKIKK